jgi:hypothetical protein
MSGRGLRNDQRGVSEVYGAVLIVAFSFGIALFLFGSGWAIVGQLTTDTTDSLTRDSMRNVHQSIDTVADASVNESTSLKFPEGSGTDLSAVADEGELNLSIRTSDDDFWNRTVAKARGKDRTGYNETVLGTIRQESDQYGEIVYQGGALWQKSAPDSDSLLLSEPNLDFTGDTLDVGIISVAGVEAITEGVQVQVKRNADAGGNEELRRFIAQYWTDRYNPSVTAPVEVNLTIESQYADGWARFAENQLSAAPKDVLYPYDGDPHKVRVMFVKIGEEPAATRDPQFGDSDILYAGSSDLAHLYYNSTVGTIDGNATTFEITDPPVSTSYELALYNGSGRWLIYNGSDWVDRDGDSVDPDASPAINASRSPASDGVDGDEYYIDPPAWLDRSGATPVCVVTDSGGVDATDYIDDAGEDCLERMVGIDEGLVDPITETSDFNITMETDDDDLDETYDVGETVDVEVNVTNEGNATGSMPAATYIINQTNWNAGASSRATFVNGTQAADLELDGGAYKRLDYTFEAAYWMADDDWVVFGVSDGTAAPVTNETTGTVANFSVETPDVQFDVVDVETHSSTVDAGDSQEVEVTVNESKDEVASPVTQHLRLTADGRIVNQTEITHSPGENATHTISWEPRVGDTGTVTLEASTHDDNATASTLVVGPTMDESTFEVEILDTNSSIEESQNLTVTANVTNTGDVADTQALVLNNFDGRPVDETDLTLDPDESREITLTWETVVGDAGNGTVDVVTGDDSDSVFAEIEVLQQDTRDPLDVVFVLDESGSMGDPACDGCTDTKGEAAVEAAKNAVGSLALSKDRAGATFFESWNARYGWTNGDRLTSDFSDSGINDTIETLNPGGGTRSDKGIDLATNIFEEESNDSRDKVMVLLSDGANDGCKNDPSKLLNDDPRDCYPNDRSLDLVQEAANDNVTTYAVGYGNVNQSADQVEIDVPFLKEVANIGGGQYYPATDDEQLAEVLEDIFEGITEPETPVFEIINATANGPVAVGDSLVVEAQIENTGTGGERVVSLVDEDGTYVDSESLSLASGESATVTLDGDTDGASPGLTDLSVRTVDDEASTTVEILGPSAGPELEITDLTTNGPVTAGDTLNVDVTLENVGGDDARDSMVSLDVVDNTTGNTIERDDTRVDVDEGDTETATLEWNTSASDVGNYTLEVETDADSRRNATRVRTSTSDLQPSIVDTSDPVMAGEELTATVDVTNTGSDAESGSLVLADARTGTTVDVAPDLDVSAGATDRRTLTWNTRVGDGDDSPVPIEAEVVNTARSDSATIEIEQVSDIQATAVQHSDSPLDIDLSEVEIETE